MIVAILNFETCSVDLWDNIPDELEGEGLEDYLTSELGYNLSAINYMCADDEIPCYYNDNEQPFNILRR